ncbi:unnamed protein product [Caenorhabditis auriculariae]|uniref:Arrestin C-terminal-like domain-containing protein n=1 Tax=Caenorhabditis auriculariae TaxID=2777116 RepID=A0A8S1HUK7_9PELO|nr:unnamed protein product [Caenorhabditis auriculariae]
MHEKVWFNVTLDRLFYLPGQVIEGQVSCETMKAISVDRVEGRLRGEAVFHVFTSKDHAPITKRILSDESCELWHYSTLSEMLGLNYDENDNKENACSSSTEFCGSAAFPIRLRVPKSAPPTFHCVGSPITIKYTLEVTLKYGDAKVATYEEPVTVVGLQMVRRNLPSAPVSIEKTLNFPKDRSIFVEFMVGSSVFSTTDRIDACINISNWWKQSLKYVHMNIVRRIHVIRAGTFDLDIVQIDTTGVGLPSGKTKIGVGESYSFRPNFHVPALPPNAAVDGLMKSDYVLKLTVGRAHNFVLGTLEIPITIVTNGLDDYEKGQEEILIDISPSASIRSSKHLLQCYA